MGDAVDVQEAGALFVPDLALDGDVSAQQTAGFGAAQAVWGLGATVGQQPIQRGGADVGQQLALRRQQRVEVFGVMRQPQRARLREPFAAGLFGRLPHALHDGQDGSVTRGRAAGLLA